MSGGFSGIVGRGYPRGGGRQGGPQTPRSFSQKNIPSRTRCSKKRDICGKIQYVCTVLCSLKTHHQSNTWMENSRTIFFDSQNIFEFSWGKKSEKIYFKKEEKSPNSFEPKPVKENQGWQLFFEKKNFFKKVLKKCWQGTRFFTKINFLRISPLKTDRFSKKKFIFLLQEK